MTLSSRTLALLLTLGTLTAPAATAGPPAGRVAPPAARDPAPPATGEGRPGATPEGERGQSSSIFRLVTRRPHELVTNLEAAFARLLGDPEEMELEVDYGKVSELLGGRFERISVRLRGGALDRLRLKHAHLEARDVFYDLEGLLSGETYMPRAVGSTRLDLTVDEESLNEVVSASRGSLRVDEPHFELEPGRIVFTGRIRFLFMRNHVRLVGSLEVRDGSRVDFCPDRVQVSSISLPGFLVQSLSRKFNPVVDLGRTPFWKSFAARLGSIETGDGYLRVRTDPAPGEAEPHGDAEQSVPMLAEVLPGSSGKGPEADRGGRQTVLQWGSDPGSM